MKGAVTFLMLVATAAAAQERPLVQPKRDVTVIYKVEGAAASVIPGGIPGPLRLLWDAAGQRLRAEPEARTQAVLVDLRAHTAVVLDTALRSTLSLPVKERDLQPLTLDGARLTRRGAAAIVGLACTNWDVQSGRGAGTVCLTADGVTLRAEGDVDGRHGSFTALNVSYGALSPELFRIPASFMQLSLPNFGRLK